MKILVTGTAGFIGFHLAKKLLEKGHEITGLDSINEYYDVNLKFGRLNECGIDADSTKYNILSKSNIYGNYSFIKLNLEDTDNVQRLFSSLKIEAVCHLAAQAGVRYSLESPHTYVDSNIKGFLNILEGCRHNPVSHLVYASSSSVYGLNENYPFTIHSNVDHPISLYAASKKANELMAHTYSNLFSIPTTGLRFFTVYGPWGRPDMALFIFTKAILENKPIEVFNNGDMFRDFTYIDDIVNGIVKMIDKPAKADPSWNSQKPDPASSKVPYKIYNIGKGSPVNLMDFIKAIEHEVGKQAKIIYKPLQPGDVVKTWADTKDLENDFNYKPSTDIKDGVKQFIKWYLSYYKK
jgi:UDP-glucuronate 4-epimerase